MTNHEFGDDESFVMEDEVSTPAARVLVNEYESMDVDGNNNNNGNNNSKKKRKETASAPEEQEGDGEPSQPTNRSGLKITEFKVTVQTVKITNSSSVPVDLTGYKLRNCDYNVSQLLPNVKLQPGETLTILPRPRSSSSKAPKNHLYWNDGDFSTFEKNTKGVRLLDSKSSFVDQAK